MTSKHAAISKNVICAEHLIKNRLKRAHCKPILIMQDNHHKSLYTMCFQLLQYVINNTLPTILFQEINRIQGAIYMTWKKLDKWIQEKKKTILAVQTKKQELTHFQTVRAYFEINSTRAIKHATESKNHTNKSEQQSYHTKRCFDLSSFFTKLWT